jgi:hypothetical protein
MSALKQLKEKRAAVHATLVESLKAEQTAETRAKSDVILAEIETIGADIARIERADAIAKEIATAGVQEQRAGEVNKEEVAKSYRKNFFEHLRYGMPGNKWQRGISDEEVRSLINTRNAMNSCADAGTARPDCWHAVHHVHAGRIGRILRPRRFRVRHRAGDEVFCASA